MDTRWEMNDGDHTMSCCTAAEIVAFLDTLTIERETFRTTTEQVLASHVVVVKRDGGRIVALGGIRKLWFAHIAYWVVVSAYQGRGHGSSICRGLVEYARQRYSFLVASVMKHNQASIRICRRVGFNPCLVDYKFRSFFCPLNWWGACLYPFYAVAFPVSWHSFHFCLRTLHSAKGYMSILLDTLLSLTKKGPRKSKS
jgi:GNAT superfamily N-acetyltransferase